MMISQLATMAIKARVRVSPATVPPKFSSRSKSRFGSLCERDRQGLRAARLGDVGLEVGPEDQGLRLGVGAGRRRRLGLTTSNRDVGVGDLRLRQDVWRRSAAICAAAGLSGRVELQVVLPAAREPVDDAGFASRRSAGRAAAIGLLGPTVIIDAGEARCRTPRGSSAGPCSMFCSVVRMLNRMPALLAADVQALDRHVGQDAGLLAHEGRRAATRSGPCTSGSWSFRRIVTSVPPVKSMLYIVWPRSTKRDQARGRSRSPSRSCRYLRGPMKSMFVLSIIFIIVSFLSQPLLIPELEDDAARRRRR